MISYQFLQKMSTEIVFAIYNVLASLQLMTRPRYKKERGGRIIEVVIWHLFEPLPGSSHPYKYRLFCGQSDGCCLVRYDNERGKGDHRHVGDTEETYTFSTVLKLIEDFEADVERM